MFIQNDPQQPIAIQQKFTKYHSNPQRLQKIRNDLELSKTILNDTKKNIGKQCQNTESIQYHIIIDNNSQPSTMTLKRLQCSATTK